MPRAEVGKPLVLPDDEFNIELDCLGNVDIDDMHFNVGRWVYLFPWAEGDVKWEIAGRKFRHHNSSDLFLYRDYLTISFGMPKMVSCNRTEQFFLFMSEVTLYDKRA